MILAHERGLTTACRMKLAGVARRLGIGDDQMEAAIKTLTAVEPSAPPNFQAERFSPPTAQRSPWKAACDHRTDD